MKTTTKTLGALIASGFLMGSLTQAAIIDVTFGSANDVLGGFTTDLGVDVGTLGEWSTETGGIQYTVAGAGMANSSLMRELTGVDALSTAAGSSYTFTSVINSSGAGDNNNNRFAMTMFANTGAADDLLATGITVAFYRSGAFSIQGGLNTFSSPDQTTTAWTSEGGAAMGTSVFTLESTVEFTATNANISFTMTDSQAIPYSDTISASFLLSELNLGEYHGFATRARTNQGDQGPFTMEAQSMSIIPEPSTLALLGIALGAMVMFRRRK